MSANKWTVSVVGAGVFGLVVLVASFHSPSRGNSPTIFAQDKNPAKPTKIYFGAKVCSDAGCHDNPAVAKQKNSNILLCGYDEATIWREHDKHKIANAVLKGKLAKQMAERLHIAGDISKEPSCIGCHGVLVENEKLKDPSFQLEDGVSCVACHGEYQEWVEKHAAPIGRDKWRALKRSVKEEQYGMRDLWDPEKRATLCASCHVGNTEQGRVVTHAMYAAGHPPLPSFELATFSDAMPRHWKYLAEKDPKVQKILEYDSAKAGLERTQLVVIGGLVSFRESMNLLASQAANDAKDKNWPELAQFDCYACHHDLKSKSWRQERGYDGKPGRPTMRAWPMALIHLGLVQASKGKTDRDKKLIEDMNAKMKELTAAFDAQPFGDPKQVAKVARGASQWADGMLKEIQTTPFDRPAAHRLLLELGGTSKQRLVDFDSACQLAWAFRAILDELEPKSKDELAKRLKELDAQLNLDLPQGQVEISKEYLKGALEKLNAFEPEQFDKIFGDVIRSVKSPK